MGANVKAARGADYVRAKPAASLLVFSRSKSGTLGILMGRRPATMAFLPGVLVFPGGKMEPQDRPLDASQKIAGYNFLEHEFPNPIMAQRFLPCAIRECAEETGIGVSAISGQGPTRYIARAITPTGRAKRYDTRFFMLVLTSTGKLPQPSSYDGELEDVGWYDPAALKPEGLHHVTQRVLNQGLAVLKLPPEADTPAPILIARRLPQRWAGQVA
ncbi:MAG: NUDIX hydrolase [Pseudomonadota bacterium]